MIMREILRQVGGGLQVRLVERRLPVQRRIRRGGGGVRLVSTT
jgi:hypothetical protein